MSSFPTLTSGTVTMWPTTWGPKWATEVVQFCNDSEQRWVGRPGLQDFELNLSNISGYDLAAVVAFFRSVKGSFDSTWDITLAGITYTKCVFTSDTLSWSETKPHCYTVTIAIRQTAAALTAYVTPSNPVYFPQLNALGMMTQHPYGVSQSFHTIGIDMPTGRRWARATRGAGLTNFPTGPLSQFTLNYPALADSEKATLLAFFNAQCGRYGEFSYLDPGGNLVPYSENYADASWTAGSLTVGSAVSDPFGGSLATTVTPAGTGTLTATVVPAGYANGFLLCASAWVKPHSIASVTLSFVDSGGTTLATQSTSVAANTWTRIECPVTLATNNVVKVRITTAVATDLFGVQVAPTLGPGGYQKTPGNYGYHAKCRFDTDGFNCRANGPNEHSLQLPVIEYF